jgi:glycosyltransferase involved in cell wall biosynthesis
LISGLRKEERNLIRCVHVIKSAQPECTGICQIVRGLAQNAPSQGYEITVLFLEDGPLKEQLQRQGIAAHTIPLRNIRSATNLCFWLRKNRAQILHLHWGGRTLRMLGRLGGARILIQHVHGRIDEITGAVSDNLHFPGVDAVIACSQAVASSVRLHRTEVIYAGVETEPAPPSLMLHTGPLQVGVLSRLTPIKNIETLLLAASRIGDGNVAVRFNIAGAGCSEASLRNMAAQLGISDRITFLGWRDDVRELLSSWDVLVITSLDEGFPIVALEAMAVARPVLANQVGGLPELIVPGVTGELIRPRDTEALANCLTKLAKDREALARMGYEGWKRARHQFSVEAMARNTTRLYNRLLGRTPVGSE